MSMWVQLLISSFANSWCIDEVKKKQYTCVHGTLMKNAHFNVDLKSTRLADTQVSKKEKVMEL